MWKCECETLLAHLAAVSPRLAVSKQGDGGPYLSLYL